MRAVAQRVTGAELKVDGKLISAIGKGLVVFFGVTHGDTEEKADYIAKKSQICAYSRMKTEK